MYFKECARLAERYPDLAGAMKQVDAQLQEMGTAEVIRIGDLASYLGGDSNQIASILEMLAQEGVLLGEEMIECPHCGMAVLRSEYEDELEEEDEFRCTGCARPLPRAAVRPITTYRRGEQWEETLKPTEDTGDVGQRPARNIESTPVKGWPDPKQHTTAKVWTTKDGSLRMSTKTDSKHDGKVEFSLREDGKPTYQMQFMRLICFRHPEPVLLREVMTEVYPEDYASMGSSPSNLLRKVRSLVSAIRTKKLAKAGLNQDILSPLSVESSVKTGISLRLARLHCLDDKDDDISSLR